MIHEWRQARADVCHVMVFLRSIRCSWSLERSQVELDLSQSCIRKGQLNTAPSVPLAQVITTVAATPTYPQARVMKTSQTASETP